MNIPPRREGETVVISRSYPVAADRVWRALTEPAELSRWFGTWTGDPASGIVEVTMTAEESDEAFPVRIDACEPGRRLAVSSDAQGTFVAWELRLDEGKSATVLDLAQRLTPGVDMGEWGPGWEFYLDRLGASLAGVDPTTIAFDAYFPARAEKFRALAE